MPRTCDNKSVGLILNNGPKIALIERINFPRSFALPAGHLDGESPETQAKNEALEEIGITVTKLEKVLHEPFNNPCKRDGGRGHEWTVFKATEWHGELRAGSDAKKASWEDPDRLQHLARRSDSFLIKNSFTPHHFDLSLATHALDADPDWQKNYALELVWLLMLRKIGILT